MMTIKWCVLDHLGWIIKFVCCIIQKIFYRTVDELKKPHLGHFIIEEVNQSDSILLQITFKHNLWHYSKSIIGKFYDCDCE